MNGFSITMCCSDICCLAIDDDRSSKDKFSGETREHRTKCNPVISAGQLATSIPVIWKQDFTIDIRPNYDSLDRYVHETLHNGLNPLNCCKKTTICCIKL